MTSSSDLSCELVDRVPDIVLLDEVDKLIERIIAFRLVSHLCREGLNLNDSQYELWHGTPPYTLCRA